jgi:hypothetical protein
MVNDQHFGIDPVDYQHLDNSDLVWDKQNEQWVIAGKETAYCHLYGGPVAKIPSGKALEWDHVVDTPESLTTYKYDKQADNEYHSNQLVAYLYVLGYSDQEISKLSIDDIVTTVREVYKYKHGEPSDLASQTYIKRKNIEMLRGIRRSNHRVQVTRNGK